MKRKLAEWRAEVDAGDPLEVGEAFDQLLGIAETLYERAPVGVTSEGFRVDIIQVTPALIADDTAFTFWSREMLRPHLLAGEAVAVQVVRGQSC